MPFKPFGTEDSDVVEVEVQPHIRRYRRHRYLKTCQCKQTPAITTTPAPAKLILRSPVVGRKNFYGAGSDWSGELTAWLSEYLQACAENDTE
ncbi:hypothetical protein [Sansalvadorimonas verongulae]|uniref:hypothetical protein n=1 Tax=Sansalvadorimonas verongulae TaxID=2172824 RepID=UPI0012BBF592|nr:hypothetical protein [Sansalvadorimonas verongulae]MTI14616.1 hypothetical protein [Sansalvadorimonas verongulae]